MLYLHKILPLLLLPLGSSSLLIVAGLLSCRHNLCWVGLVVLWICSTPVVSNATMRAAEGWVVRQPVATAPSARAIVVLSGGRVQPPGDFAVSEWNEAVDRFDAGVELFLAGKAPLLVLTGGWSPRRPDAQPEGAVLAEYAVARGVPRNSLLVTGRVSNTAEEAQAVAQLLAEQPDDGQPILLVTSAYHMRRARLLFVRTGLQVAPFPVDFQVQVGGSFTILDLVPNTNSLAQMEMALREFYGTLYYRLVLLS